MASEGSLGANAPRGLSSGLFTWGFMPNGFGGTGRIRMPLQLILVLYIQGRGASEISFLKERCS